MIRFKSSMNSKWHAAEKFSPTFAGGKDGLASLCRLARKPIDQIERWDHESKITCKFCQEYIRSRIANLQSCLPEEKAPTDED